MKQRTILLKRSSKEVNSDQNSGAIEKSQSMISKYWKNKHFEDKSNIILIFWPQIVFVWIDIIIVKLCI